MFDSVKKIPNKKDRIISSLRLNSTLTHVCFTTTIKWFSPQDFELFTFLTKLFSRFWAKLFIFLAKTFFIWRNFIWRTSFLWNFIYYDLGLRSSQRRGNWRGGASVNWRGGAQGQRGGAGGYYGPGARRGKKIMLLIV